MAIQTTFQSSMGFDITDAYIRISRFTGDKSTIKVQLEVYYNQSAKVASAATIGSPTIELEITNGATMQQMYDALKLLPEFAGAIDV
jgi:hypothetical protein